MNFTFIKKHPVGSGAAVLIGGFVLYMLLSGGSSSAPSNGTVQQIDPNAAAIQQQNAAMQMQQDQEGAQFALALLGSTTTQNLATIQSQQDIILGTQQNENVASQIVNQGKQIELQAATQNKAIDAQLAEATLTSNNQTQVQMLGIAANEKMQENQLQASVDNTNTMANLQLNISSTNAALQQHIVESNNQAQVAMSQINSQTQLGIANTQANASMHNQDRQSDSSDTSSWIGAAVGIASLFCDVNLKCKMECVSTKACLEAIREIPLVQFNYIAGTEPYKNGDIESHVNTLSQDFYKSLGVEEYNKRVKIDLIDMLGAMLGAIKELDGKNG